MDELKYLNPKIYTASAIIVGFLLIDDLNVYEQSSLGNWLYLVGQVLISNSSQQALVQSELYNKNININSKINKSIYDPIFYNIDHLEKIISETTPDNVENVVKILSKLVNDINIHINNIKK